MGMIVQTLSVSETRHERSLEKAIAKRFKLSSGEPPRLAVRQEMRQPVGASHPRTR